MSEVETKTAVADPEEVVLRKKDLTAIGVENVEELQVLLKRAVTEGRDLSTVDKLATALDQHTEKFTAAMQAMTAGMVAEKEAEVFEKLSGEALVKKFKETSANDPDRLKMARELVKEYGTPLTMVALDQNEYRKMLKMPVSKSNPHKEEIDEFRLAHDYFMLALASYEGIEARKGGDDVYDVNKGQAQYVLNRLEKAGMPGIDYVRKGIDEAMDTQTATEGLEWVPTIMSNNMIQDLYLALKVAALFPRYTMYSKSQDIPRRLARGRAYGVNEATLYNQFFSNLARVHAQESDKMTFTAKKIGALQLISDELDQDAILDVLGMMRQDVVDALAFGTEDGVINGSTLLNDLDNASTDTNRLWNNTADQGDGIRLNTGSADIRNQWDGLRKLTNSGAKIDQANAAITLANLRGLRKKMGKYGASITDLIFLIGIKSHIDLLSIGQIETLEKYGPNATILTGEVAKIDNIPVILSQYVYENLNATGVFDNVTTNRSIAMCFDRTQFAFGDRRLIRVETDRQMLSGQTAVLATWRGDFKKLQPTADNVVALNYNLNAA